MKTREVWLWGDRGGYYFCMEVSDDGSWQVPGGERGRLFFEHAPMPMIDAAYAKLLEMRDAQRKAQSETAP